MHWSSTISIIINVMKIIISNAGVIIEQIDFLKFQLTNIWSDSCNVNLFALTQTLKHECENNSLFEAWEPCEGITKWYINYWSHLMKTLAKVLVVPPSIAICGNNFSKQMLSRTIYEPQWSWKLWMLWCEVIMWHKGGENGLEGGVWNVAQHEFIFLILFFGLNLRKNSFIFVNLICFGGHTCVWKLKILSTCHWKCIC